MRSLRIGWVLLLVACGGGSGGGGGGGSAGGGAVACMGTFAGRKVCFAYDAAVSAQAKAECANDGLPLVDACSTQGIVGGCCDIPASDLSGSDLSVNECFYSGTAADNESDCKGLEGTWQPR